MNKRKEITWAKILIGYGLMALIICGFTACQIDQIDKRVKRIEDSVASPPRTLIGIDTTTIGTDTVLIEKYIRRK